VTTAARSREGSAAATKAASAQKSGGFVGNGMSPLRAVPRQRVKRDGAARVAPSGSNTACTASLGGAAFVASGVIRCRDSSLIATSATANRELANRCHKKCPPHATRQGLSSRARLSSSQGSDRSTSELRHLRRIVSMRSELLHIPAAPDPLRRRVGDLRPRRHRRDIVFRARRPNFWGLRPPRTKRCEPHCAPYRS
jgi:hypothetical protein